MLGNLTHADVIIRCNEQAIERVKTVKRLWILVTRMQRLSIHCCAEVIDRLADKRIVHANKAARHKSRLSKAINLWPSFGDIG